MTLLTETSRPTMFATTLSSRLSGFHGSDMIPELVDFMFQLIQPECFGTPSVQTVDRALGGSAPKIHYGIIGVRNMGFDQGSPPVLQVGQLVFRLLEGEIVANDGAQLFGSRPASGNVP